MLILTVKRYAGSFFATIAKDAQNLADRLGVDVTFDFDGVHCYARKGGSADRLIAEFETALHEKQTTALS